MSLIQQFPNPFVGTKDGFECRKMSLLANYLVTLFILSGMIELLRKIVHGKEPSENPLPKLGDKVIEFLGLTDGPNIPCKERKGT